MAVPSFRQRIAPRLDSQCRVLILDCQAGQRPRLLKTLVWREDTMRERLRALERNRVDLLVCGAVEPWAEEAIQARGIRTISWACRRVEWVLSALEQGRLGEIGDTCPGRRGRSEPGRET